MNSHYFRIGLFFIATTIILIAALIAVSADIFTSDTFLMETYIDESVQGLDVGSPLHHRGVKIGRVKKITFASQEYPMGDNDSAEFDRFGKYVMVIMAVDKKHYAQRAETDEEIKSLIRNQIRNGLRLKLSYQGITGIAYMEADYFDPVRNPPLVVPWQTKYIYVPSEKSLITSFTQAVDSVFQRLDKIDFPAIFAQLESTLKAMQTAVEDAHIPTIHRSIVELTGQFGETARRIEGLIGDNEDNIAKTLDDLRTAIRNLKQLSEQLKADPAQMLLSAPPAGLETTK